MSRSRHRKGINNPNQFKFNTFRINNPISEFNPKLIRIPNSKTNNFIFLQQHSPFDPRHNISLHHRSSLPFNLLSKKYFSSLKCNLVRFHIKNFRRCDYPSSRLQAKIFFLLFNSILHSNPATFLIAFEYKQLRFKKM